MITGRAFLCLVVLLAGCGKDAGQEAMSKAVESHLHRLDRMLELQAEILRHTQANNDVLHERLLASASGANGFTLLVLTLVLGIFVGFLWARRPRSRLVWSEVGTTPPHHDRLIDVKAAPVLQRHPKQTKPPARLR